MDLKWFILVLLFLSGVFGDVSAVDAADPGSFAVNDMAGRTFDERCRIGLERQLADTEPSYEGRGDPMRYVFNRCNYALASLFLNRNPEAGNQAVLDACNTLSASTTDPKFYMGEAGLHWHGMAFSRLFFLFCESSRHHPGRLSADAERRIKEVLWPWVKAHSRLTDTETEVSRSWFVWESENHDIMHDSLCWAAAKIFRDDPEYASRVYDDGSTPVQQHQAWERYFEVYLLERCRKGLFVEIASFGYAKHTLQCLYNLYDFSDKGSLLKLRAKAALDLWWADWAQEQVNGVRGGSKARCYQTGSSYSLGPCQMAAYQSGREFSWYYMGIGQEASRNHCVMAAVTSGYRMPQVIVDIALDVAGRGVYEIVSRRPGLNLRPRPVEVGDSKHTRTYALDPDFGGILKYSYCAPEFIVGTSMRPKLPESAWANISDQNMWHGIIFSSHPDARIYPQCETDQGTPGTSYNQQLSVQNKGTLIVQKHDQAWKAGDLRVWFADMLEREETNGWVFVKAGGAYAAVRPATGGYSWDEGGKWMRPEQTYAPLIMEVVRSCEFDGYEHFKRVVCDQQVVVRDDVLVYQGLLDSGHFKFYLDGSRAPTVNGEPVNVAPAFTFKSPFLNQDWASDRILIEKDLNRLEIDLYGNR